jgi:hypothetical protein
MNATKAGIWLRFNSSLLAVTALLFSVFLASAQTVQTNLAATVRHAPCLNGGTIQGSLQQLNGESVAINNGFAMTGDLLVPGTPTLVLNGKSAYSGTIAGSGSASPTGYKITLNGGSSLRYLRTRTTPVSLPAVPVPPAPKGTRIVYINSHLESLLDFIQELLQQNQTWQEILEVLNNNKVSIISAGQSYGDAATLRDLILNGNAGTVTVPPGSYGNFVVNGGSTLVLGIAGGLQPVNYNLQNLVLNGASTLKIVGPVILTVGTGFIGSGTIGASNHPEWLQLQLAGGGLALNGGCTVYGLVLAPNGTVTINCNSTLVGILACDQFVLNSGGSVRWAGASPQLNQPPTAIAQNISVAENSPTNINLTGSDPQGKTLAFTLLTQPSHGILSGTPPSVTYRPATNYFGSDAFTFKVNNGVMDSSPATVSLTVTQIFYPPTAIAQTLTNYENAALAVTLTGSDPQGYALSFSVLTPPGHGSLSGTAPNLTYRPVTNYYGNDFFTFQANDGVSNSAAAAISITNKPVDYPPVVVAGPNQLIILPTNIAYLAGSVSYAPFPGTADTVVWSKVSGPGTVTFGNPSSTMTTAAFSQSGIYRLRLFASDSFLTGSNDLVVTVDAPPVVNAGTSQFVTLGAPVTLVGSYSDDGIPGSPVTTFWTQISGPSGAVFANPASPNTAVSFSQSGVYVFQLTANDGLANGSAQVTITVNQAPVVTAVSPVLVNWPANQVVLNGTVTDDGLPNGGTLTSAWSQVVGPTQVNFSSPFSTNVLNGTNVVTNPSTTASFDAPGLYLLRLSASDGVSTNSGNVSVIVNQSPVVSVSADKLTLPLPGTVNLTGIVSDDGLPNGILTYAWSQVGGPGTASFGNPNLTNSFSQPGIYTIQLTASDTTATGSGQIALTVLAASQSLQATAQSLVIDENTPLPLTLNGTDITGDPLTFSVVSPPANGTLSGTPPNLVYQPATNYTGADSFTFLANDGQASSATATVSITINAVAPVISVPAGQTVAENSALQFGPTRLISIADAHVGTGLLQLSLSVANGTLTLGATNGLEWVAGGDGSGNIVVNGSLDDLNGALAGLTYAGNTNFYGADGLVVGVEDLGFAGLGSDLADSKTIAIIVTPDAELPNDATAGTNFWVGVWPQIPVVRESAIS